MAFFDKPQSENFIENGKKEITLGKICKAMEIPVPARFKTIEDKINNNITTSPKR